MQHRPLVIAHRGSSGAHPEHTLKAYEQAVIDGADGVECDVRLTRDGHLVCVHDRTLKRTSDGKGVVSTRTLEQLGAHDWGSWKGEGHSAEVLPLRTLIEFLLGADRPMQLVIETKHPTRYFSGTEQKLARMLEEYGLLEPSTARIPVRLMSFSTGAVQRFSWLAPKLERVQLIEGTQVMRFRNKLGPGVRIAGPGVPTIRRDPRFVARHHAAGNDVHVWTADTPDDIRLLIDLKVQAIISNYPDRVLDALG